MKHPKAKIESTPEAAHDLSFAAKQGASKAGHTVSNLSSRPTTKDPAERETEREWRDPQNAYLATLIRGVLPKPRGVCCATHHT